MGHRRGGKRRTWGKRRNRGREKEQIGMKKEDRGGGDETRKEVGAGL